MKKIWDFIDKFENSKRFLLIAVGFIAVSQFILQTDGSETLGFIKISKKWVFNFDLTLVLINMSIILLEAAYILTIGYKDSLTEFLAKILSSINKIITLLFKVLYVLPLALILKPVILNVIEKQKPLLNNGIKFLFSNNALGNRADDRYFDKIVNVKNLSIYLKPSDENKYWRFGIKFSKDKKFPTSRFDDEHILFHLTKDANKSELEHNLYQPNNNFRKTLLTNYTNQACWIIIKTDSRNTKISVLNEYRHELEVVKIPQQKYAQIFAWADGEASYKIKSLVSEN